MSGKTKEIPDKKLRLYEAVWELMGEGIDINDMKVLQITTRAGIGKGTAYEYFNSREEMIIEAIFYFVNKKISEMQNILNSNKTFDEKMYDILNWSQENKFECQGYQNFHQFINGEFEFKGLFQKEVEQSKQVFNDPIELLSGIYETGLEEGVINPQLPKPIVILTIISKITILMITLDQKADIKKEEIDWLKGFLVETLKKDLS